VNESIAGFVLVYKNVADLIVAHEEVNRLFEEQKAMLKGTQLLNEKLSVTGSLTRHDVKNKLGALTSYLHVVKKHLADNADAQRYLVQTNDIIKNIMRILEFSKTYEMLGRQERTFEDVGKMVQDAASLFTDLKGVAVINECRGFHVLADSLLMELFHNLIDNSLKYGKTLTQIHVYTCRNEDNSMNLIYEDNGVGIDPSMKDMLFRKGFGQGTGYGLYLIKRICEMYGWIIQETGEFGKGVRFIIGLPRQA
jgi:signal transduction histidine kinase